MRSKPGSSQPEDFFGAPDPAPQPVSESMPMPAVSFEQAPVSAPSSAPDQMPTQIPEPEFGQGSDLTPLPPKKNNVSFRMGLASLLLALVYPVGSNIYTRLFTPTVENLSSSSGALYASSFLVLIFAIALTLSLVFGIIAIVKSKAKGVRPKSRSGQVLGIIGIVISGVDIVLVTVVLSTWAYLAFAFMTGFSS